MPGAGSSRASPARRLSLERLTDQRVSGLLSKTLLPGEIGYSRGGFQCRSPEVQAADIRRTCTAGKFYDGKGIGRVTIATISVTCLSSSFPGCRKPILLELSLRRSTRAVVDHLFRLWSKIVAMREVAIAEFKAKCLSLLDEGQKTKQPIRITRCGHPSPRSALLRQRIAGIGSVR